jgi:[glutamine synthetase] adenylyltransferase / [glutamine synthetase]-adenylyl-L-tyrosine phosphorylase
MIHPTIRTRATLKAIPRLREQGLLSPADAHILTEGYVFLRTVEHYLQMIDYRQNYTLPSDPSALALLARRLGFEGSQAGGQFIESYEQHCQAIRSVFLKHVGNEPQEISVVLPQSSPQLIQHIARMDASYSATFSPEEIQRHALLAGKIDNQTISIVDALAVENGRWRVTVVGYDYLGELSLICGLMFVYGLDITESQAFTYEPAQIDQSSSAQIQNARRKIVDVFTVRSVQAEAPTPEMWSRYANDLHVL